MELIDRLIDPIRYPEFGLGLLVGVVTVVGWLTARRLRPPPRVAVGSVLVAGVLVGFWWLDLLTGRLLGGLGLLALGAGAYRAHAWLAVMPVLAGAGVLAVRFGPVTSGFRAGVAIAGLGLMLALVWFDRRSPHREAGALWLLVTAGGIYATVPSTQEARLVMAALLVVAVASVPLQRGRLGPTGALLVGGLLTWVIATGGFARPGSIVGAFAASGLLLADPVARALMGRSALDRVPATVRGMLGLGAVQLSLSLFASRVAGLREGYSEAALIAGPVLVVTVLVLAFAGRSRAPAEAS